MIPYSLKSDAGYSLVEVMVSIMILSMAIIPMVAMFDTALISANTSGNYDKARALANKQLENAKSGQYKAIRDDFPNGTAAPVDDGEKESDPQEDPDFPGFTYTITKQFVTLNGSNEIVPSADDEGMMKIRASVSRPGTSVPYTATSVITDGGKPSGEIVVPNGDEEEDPPPPVPECRDGINNDDWEDSLADFNTDPAFSDPGCTSPDDDSEDPNPPGLSISDVSTTEGNSGNRSFTFTVTPTGDKTGTIKVNYATANGSATIAGSDYNSASGTLIFAPRDTSETITVQVRGDAIYENNETFSVNLSGATGTVITDGTGVGTIQNDDTPPTFSINDVTTTEGNSGTKNFTFTVTRTGSTSLNSTVNYATANGSATTAGSDYNSDSGTLTFAPGETSKPVTVQVRGDATYESNETFTVNLSGATNSTISDNQGVGTIQNDDTAPTLSINNVTTTEGNSSTKNFTFTVTLSGSTGLNSTVNYATANGTNSNTRATAGSDYNSASGTLTFAPGETSKTVTVQVRGDRDRENDEIFTVNLSNANNSTISDNQGVGTIQNDD